MANLLDSASIVLTPTAYDNGSMLSVKPNDGAGDFDFSRNSAATRVNAQGLVENVQILSGDLVSNGDFSQEGVEEVSNGSFSQEGAELVTNGSFESGTTDWSAYYSGSLNNNGNALNVVSIGANDTRASTSIITEIGKTYRYECDIIQIQSTSTNLSVSNNINLDGNFAYGSIITTPTNSVSITFKATATTTYVGFKRSGNAADGITNIYDNVSVKEVGQDWNLGSGWSIGEDKVIGVNVITETTQQIFPSATSRLLKITYSIIANSGEVAVYMMGQSKNWKSTSGTYTDIVASSNANLQFDGRDSSPFSGSVTNISVIEITDDTNLPRINYEGFSYQDSLGSEEVVNGSFDSDTNWNNFGTPLVSQQSSVRYYSSPFSWYIKGNAFRQGIFSPNNFTLTNGKTYKVSLWVYAENGTEIQCGLTNTNQSVFATRAITQSQWTNINYLATANATSNSYISILTSNSTFEFYVDNVSIKEVTGQEVVPDSGCGSWLLEPQSTNLVTYSEDFSQWSNARTIDTANATISPEGTNNATLVEQQSGQTNSGSIYLANLGSLSGTYTQSVYAKKQNKNYIVIYDANAAKTYFNLENGTIGTIASGNTAKIEDIGNGWYRCSTTYSTSGSVIAFYVADNNNSSVVTDNGGVYIWGAMLEQQSYATSYIPTNGSNHKAQRYSDQ